MKPKTKYSKVPLGVSVHLAYLFQDLKLPFSEICKRYPNIPVTTIRRHAKKRIGAAVLDNRTFNKGRPRKLSPRDERAIITSLIRLRENNNGNLYSTDIQNDAGLGHVSNMTVRRVLASKGYRCTQCRRKGQLSKKDLQTRMRFAQRCKNLPQDTWTKGISFYLDGTSWVHKSNPSKSAKTARTRTWKKQGESLSIDCLAKGCKEGVNGKRAKFMVAIAHGKGVIGCYQYQGRLNGEQFSQIVKDTFPDLFSKSANPTNKVFLQDGCPVQTSKVARQTWESLGYEMFAIPPRSPDLNPIENTFHSIGKQIRKDAVTNRIEKETYKQFCDRVKRIVLNFNKDVIDRTIESMPRRLDAVIKGKGNRTKY